MERRDVVIIGAGIGGLICGALLAKRGFRVAIFEKEERPGGYCCSFSDKGYVFDACIDSIGCLRKNGFLRGVMEDLGILNKVQLIEVQPIRKNIFPDFSIDIPSDPEEYKNTLKGLFPAETKGIDKIFGLMDNIYEYSIASALGESVRFDLNYWIGKTFQNLLDSCVDDIHLQAVLSSYCNFSGLPPSELSAIVAVNALMHYVKGGSFRVRGGIQKLIDALVEGIQDNHGEVVLAEAVKKIVTEKTKTKGIVTETGRMVNAAHIISNIDTNTVVDSILDPLALDEEKVDRIRKLEVSGSFIIAYLGIARELSQYDVASSMGYFSSFDGDAMLNKDKRISFGMSIPSILDDSLAPRGCSSVLIHYPVYNSNCTPSNKNEIIDKVIQHSELFIPDIAKHIVYKKVADAKTLHRFTGNSRGAAYGWRQNAGFLANSPFLRTLLDNFHLVGHWAGYGGGIMPSALSALRVVNRISR